MKALKLSLSLALSSILLLLLNFTSCKKDKTEAMPITAVTADDLLAYNIIASVADKTNDKQQLRLLYFSKAGNEVTATLDGITSRRAQVINLVNNSFTFDTNGDGKVVYTFTLKKDKAGKLSVGDFKYVNLTTPTYTAVAAIASKLTDLPSVKNKTFKSGGGVIVKFNTDTWLTSANPNVTGSFYEISAGAWKGSFGGEDYIGVSLVENNQLLLVVQEGDHLTPFAPY